MVTYNYWERDGGRRVGSISVREGDESGGPALLQVRSDESKVQIAEVFNF